MAPPRTAETPAVTSMACRGRPGEAQPGERGGPQSPRNTRGAEGCRQGKEGARVSDGSGQSSLP